MLLQTPVISPEELTQKADSLKRTADSFAEALATDPKGALSQLGVDMIHFGLKVLLAIIIYIIGIWLIRLVK